MNILTRKNLKALNVPDEAIDPIVEAHSDAINDIKAERDKYAEQAKQIAALTTELDTLKQQLADAKKSAGDAQKIQEEFDAYKQQVETEKEPITKCYQCPEHCNPAKVPYCITKALVNAVKGDLDHGLIFCGANVGRIKKLMSDFQIPDSVIQIARQ